MKKILLTIPVCALFTGCAFKSTDNVTDFYAFESIPACESKTFYLAEAYKYQKPGAPKNDRVTTYEYVCAKAEDDTRGKTIKTREQFEALQDSPDEHIYALAIPKSEAFRMGFRHLYRK